MTQSKGNLFQPCYTPALSLSCLDADLLVKRVLLDPCCITKCKQDPPACPAVRNHLGVAAYLLERGMDVNAKDIVSLNPLLGLSLDIVI